MKALTYLMQIASLALALACVGMGMGATEPTSEVYGLAGSVAGLAFFFVFGAFRQIGGTR